MTSQPLPETLFFNGLDGASGDYLLPPMTPAQLSALAQGQSFAEAELAELKQRAFDLNNPHAGVEADARDLAETGWGLIAPAEAAADWPALYEALQPLLRLRQEQAGERYKEFTGGDGYRPGESKDEFLLRHGMGPGPANPDRVPYYLLIVAGPQQVPFRFQYQLDVQYAVGRLHFEALEDYASYASSVATAEAGLALRPQAAFFGVANPEDRATQLSAGRLVQPLAERLLAAQPQWQAAAEKARAAGLARQAPQWEVQSILKDEATRQCLSDLLNGPQAPALLFTASHGVGFPNGDPRQLPHQGALVCQDWPGPQLWRGALPEDFYFSADHLNSDANLLGMLAFFFACYGAGTPQEDEFAQQLWGSQPQRRQIAPRDFVASLPRRMLSLPRGGALAVVGHVERAWGSSFYWGQAGPQLQVFSDCFERLLKGGYPVGYAVEVFNNRYAELSADLSSELNDIRSFGKRADDLKLANLWTANNDARNYVILGDPAARLPVSAAAEAPAARPEIASIRLDLNLLAGDGHIPVSPVSPAVPGPAPGQPEAAPPAPVQAQPVSAPALADEYGLVDSFKQAQAGMSASLQQFVGQLGAFLSRALEDAATLEVATYVSEDMEGVKYEGGKFSGAKLRALVRIKIDGDTLICVPEDEGEIDTDLWKIHMDMVQQAQSSRAELLKTAISAASGLANLVKPG